MGGGAPVNAADAVRVWSIVRLAVAVGVLTAVAMPLLGGCARPQPAPVVTVTAGSESADGDPLRPAPTDALEALDDGSVVTPAPASTLVLDDAARSSAVTQATAVMAAFASAPGESAQQWWSQLRPLMSESGREVYASVDPANVPVTEVTGDAMVEATSVASVARVAVPTDAGVYVVVLVRTDKFPAWAADRLIPPTGQE